MIKAIIFDFFGVIYTDTFDEIYEKFGGDIDKERNFIKKVFHDSFTGKTEKSSLIFANRFNVDLETWESELWKNRSVNEELLEYIDQIHNKYKTAILSNIGSRGLDPYVPLSVMEKYFDEVVVSSKIGYAKPEVKSYEITAMRLGVRPDECVFVDDRQEYLEGADRVGMKTILYEDIDRIKEELEGLL